MYEQIKKTAAPTPNEKTIRRTVANLEDYNRKANAEICRHGTEAVPRKRFDVARRTRAG
jgi:hypothetical protein